MYHLDCKCSHIWTASQIRCCTSCTCCWYCSITDHPWYSSDRFLSIHDLHTNPRHVLRSDRIQILNAILADQIRDHKQAHHNNISSFAISLVPSRARPHKKPFPFPFLFLSSRGGKILLFFCTVDFFFSFFPSFTFFFPDWPTDRRRHHRWCHRRRRPRWVLACACTNQPQLEVHYRWNLLDHDDFILLFWVQLLLLLLFLFFKY